MYCLFAGDVYAVRTPGDRDYHHVWATPLYNEQTFTFYVAACKEAVVVLATTVGDILHDAYELTLGTEDNTKVVLKKAVDGELVVVKEVDLYHSLNCLLLTRFWVAWDNGIIRAGRGDMYVYQFLYWEDPDENYPRIHGIALTNEDDSDAIWRFPRDQG